ncbi:uncharacterized protein LOC106083096 [Stomoxys calcitrans]|uniref:Uncharacterized protein n=1 Tax=Stomoxys calcitrans TaxID=35570 RepID=A0A1I8PHC4_STOCA|nr:uncharacterized protein LOC106083096 [Stomoxys calcitrans]
MKAFRLLYVTAIVVLGSQIAAIPIEPTDNEVPAEADKSPQPEGVEEESNQPTTTASKPEDSETSNSNPQATYVLPDNQGSGSHNNFDPSIYAGYLTPEAFQQYLSQFAGAFAPYAYPGYATGPTPVYPGPFAVQTGYDGFLVPAVQPNLPNSNTAVSTSVISHVVTALQSLSTLLMSSPFFQIIMTVLGVVAMIVFGGAITTGICNFTPLCSFSLKAVTYLRGNGAADVGRMIAEEMTPERVRRAAEFVRNAIRKYKQMQVMMKAEEQGSD